MKKYKVIVKWVDGDITEELAHSANQCEQIEYNLRFCFGEQIEYIFFKEVK